MNKPVDTMQRSPRTLKEILDQHEKIILIKSIQASGGSRSQAVASLGITRSYLYRRASELGIDLSQIPARKGRPSR